jgi:hypothetical protein
MEQRRPHPLDGVMKPVIDFYANDVPGTAKISKWKLFTIVPLDTCEKRMKA